VNEHRFLHDRRRFARGGRREGDRPGFAPMVVVIDRDARRRDISEAILAKLRFAVAPFESADKALAAMHALRPEAVVARADAVEELRGRLPNDRDGRTIPLLPITDDADSEPVALVEALRRLLHDHWASS
jgi:FixJ family two-component response regulator